MGTFQCRCEIIFPSEIINQYNQEVKLRCRLLRQTEIQASLLDATSQRMHWNRAKLAVELKIVFVFRDDSFRLGKTRIRLSKELENVDSPGKM